MQKEDILSRYMPEGAAPVIARWIDYFQCEFKISKPRSTKLGDYRHPFRGAGHKISVNNSLNSYAFLVTTVHEFAHLVTWNEHKNKVKPHGEEWKVNFRRMMIPFIQMPVFPDDLKGVITNYLNNPSAASCTDLALSRALKKFDTLVNVARLEELPIHSTFSIKDGRKFKKGERLKKRYRCLSLDNGNIYLFNPLAEVTLTGT
ncbi:MAG: SprT-like domain-containing protein [Bacteroidota bacterium]